jgi:hypothetical protein
MLAGAAMALFRVFVVATVCGSAASAPPANVTGNSGLGDRGAGVLA